MGGKSLEEDMGVTTDSMNGANKSTGSVQAEPTRPSDPVGKEVRTWRATPVSYTHLDVYKRQSRLSA